MIGLDIILVLSVGSCASPMIDTVLFSSHGLVALEEIKQLSNAIWVGTKVAEIINSNKDKWLYVRLFSSSELDL